MDPETWQLEVVAGTTLDHELRDNYSVRIRVEDKDQLVLEKIFQVTVTDRDKGFFLDGDLATSSWLAFDRDPLLNKSLETMEGKLMVQKSNMKGRSILDLSALSQAVYLARIRNERGIFTEKLFLR